MTDGRPLYAQVEAVLIQRLTDGTWHPGALLPSEFELADELGVSQGTVRRALGLLERRRLIERRRGRGTVVARQTSARALYHFFRVVDASGAPVVPSSSFVIQHETARARQDERTALRLPARAEVHRMVRVRSIGGAPLIFERITLPAAIFPGFDIPLNQSLPHEFYVLYQSRHAVTVTHAKERLSAVAADGMAARHLGLPPGTPLQKIDRIAYDYNDRVIEWRVSLLNSSRHFYLADLR